MLKYSELHRNVNYFGISKSCLLVPIQPGETTIRMGAMPVLKNGVGILPFNGPVSGLKTEG